MTRYRAGEPDVRHTLDVNMTVVPHVLLADGQDEDTPNTPGIILTNILQDVFCIYLSVLCSFSLLAVWVCNFFVIEYRLKSRS